MRKLKKLLSLEYEYKNKKHNAAFVTVVLLLCFVCFLIPSKPRHTVNYPLSNVKNADIYVKQFDAVYKHRLSLDIVPDEKLTALENPYDPQARKDVDALWDHAYFEGQYYSYFGIAPIFTLYYPFYFATKALPNSSFACLILALVGVWAIALAYREFVIAFVRKANIVLLLAGLAGVVFSTGIYLGLLCSDIYYVAVLSALCSTALCVFFVLRGVREARAVKRNIMMVCGAAALVAAVCSRPTAALMCAAVVPMFFSHIIKMWKTHRASCRFTFLSFAIPLLSGAAAVMWYNYARFGSPFDFGANYQLTVSDISKNRLDASLFPAAVAAYFCHSFALGGKGAECMDKVLHLLPQNAGYIYAERYVGAFAYGLPVALLLTPRLPALDKKRGEPDKIKTATAAVTAAVAVFVAFSDFCLAGVNMRYIYDITPILSMVACVILLDIRQKSKGAERGLITALACVLCVAAVVAGILTVRCFSEIIGR